MYGTLYGMVKTTLYLTQELKLRIERRAREQRQSEAEVIRNALDASLPPVEPPRPRVPLFNSGDPTLAERVDEILAEGFGRD